jgi:hypothetical protein
MYPIVALFATVPGPLAPKTLENRLPSTFDALAHSRPIPDRDPGGQYPSSVKPALAASPGIQLNDPAVVELSRELVLNTKNKAAQARQVYEFVAREIGALRSTATMDAVTVIREGRGNDLGRARLFCALTRTNGLPCRVMAGIPLASGRQDQFRYWNEAYFLRAFLSYNSSWRIEYFNTFVNHRCADLITKRMPLCRNDRGGQGTRQPHANAGAAAQPIGDALASRPLRGCARFPKPPYSPHRLRAPTSVVYRAPRNESTAQPRPQPASRIAPPLSPLP